MQFRLFYRGRLKGNANAKEKQALRREFQKQLRVLWKQSPLTNYHSMLVEEHKNSHFFRRKLGDFVFVPLATENMDVIADLHITLLRPEAPGSIVTQSGDIDNRLKTLFDAMRMPQSQQELPSGDSPAEGENPFYVLLEDDNLISSVSITTDRLLEEVSDQLDVVLIIKVDIKVTRATIENIALGV